LALLIVEKFMFQLVRPNADSLTDQVSREIRRALGRNCSRRGWSLPRFLLSNPVHPRGICCVDDGVRYGRYLGRMASLGNARRHLRPAGRSPVRLCPGAARVVRMGIHRSASCFAMVLDGRAQRAAAYAVSWNFRTAGMVLTRIIRSSQIDHFWA
jgi:hypothetical protein